MRIAKYCTVLAALIIFSGCTTERADSRRIQRIKIRNPELFQTKEHDSSIGKVTYQSKDTSISLPPKQLGFTDTLPRLNFYVPGHIDTNTFPGYKKTVKSHGMTASVDINSKGVIHVDCKDDSLKMVIKLMQKTIDSTHYKKIDNYANKLVALPLTKWQSFCEVAIWIELIILLLYVGIKEGPAIIKAFKGGL